VSQLEADIQAIVMLNSPFRSANGVLVSDVKGRDIKIDSYTLSFHGRLLIEGAEISLNYGQRYGLLGENGSGKSTFLKSIAERDVDIPEHIDVSRVRIDTVRSGF
jgi:ATP-binding cassette subfamily F protein 2